MPSKSKTKNATAAHQHDKRHESGLAAPGKRVVRQRSNQNLQQQQQNGHVNGRPNGNAISSTVNTSLQSSLASTAVDHGYDVSRSLATEILRPALPHAAGGQRDHVESLTRERAYSDASNDGFEGYGEGAEDGAYFSSGMDGMRRQSFYGQQPKGTLEIMSTILTYYPLRDAIFILILLLSLPPTVVPIIQALFASLTFVPPSTAISITSIKELFHASTLGYPALMAVLVVDLIFYLCWLPVWKPVQSMLLDLSQAVIAVSLSGAAASTAGPTYSFLSCSAVVCAVHVLRYRAIHLTAFDYLRSVLAKLEIGLDLSAFPAFSTTNSFFSTMPITHESWLYTAVRTFLGIHIISQGITTSVRRSLASANERSNHVPVIAKTDPEASAGQDLSNRSSNSATPDLTPHQSVSQNLDTRAVTTSTSPIYRDGKTRESSSKRRKRQANEVRSKQPLWAAIASTKVTFVKEMEQRDAADDVKETTNMNKSNNAIKIPTFPTTTKATSQRIWVEEVRDTEIVFRAELSAQVLASHKDIEDGDLTVGPGIDKRKPFYVRVNSAAWSSIKIELMHEPQHDIVEYQCDIFGLAPHSYYLCELVSTASHEVLCSTRSITQAAHIAEQQIPVSIVATQHLNLRPSSPVSTLRKSIEQASASLAEARGKSRKTKKDQKAAYSDIRREVNTFKNKLDNSGGTDDRQAKKLQQMTQHRSQADEAVIQIAKQIAELGDLPRSDIEAADNQKREWRSVDSAKKAAHRMHDAARLENDTEIKDAKAELCAAESKLHKLQSRTEQRREELANIATKQEAEATARLKHTQERAHIKLEQDNRDSQIRFHITSMNNETELNNSKAAEAWNQAQALYHTWPASHLSYSSPPTPEDMQQQINGFGSHQAFNAYHAPHAHHVAPVIGPRGRSSSMLSQYSGFTDNGEEQPFEMRQHYTWPANKHPVHVNGAVIDDRKESEGSSNGSSGTNGSTASSSPRPDARAFVPSAKIGPIRPPPRNKTSSPRTLEIASPSPPPPGRNGSERQQIAS